MSTKASNKDCEADSGSESWSTGGDHSWTGVVPFLVLWMGCLSLLLAIGIATAQTAVNATPDKPGVAKRLPATGFQIKAGTVKQIPPDVSQIDPDRLTKVPILIGHRQEELSNILEKARLYLGAVASAYSDDPAGVVTAQSPDAGQTVLRGTTVAVTVSRGPDILPVPDVTTRSLSVAKEMLARADLNVGNVVETESESSVETVLDQRPLPGAKVSRGSSVDLTIAVAPKNVLVPGLTGLTEEASRQRLTDAGLTEGGREERNADEPAGTIIGQDPVAGTMVPPGTAVNRVVSAGPLPPIADVTPPISPIPEVPTPRVPIWVVATIVAVAVLAGAGFRSLTKRREPRRGNHDNPMRGLEIHAVQDEGKQRLSRDPDAGSSFGLVAHPDDAGRQRLRLHRDSDSGAGEGKVDE
jgi:serine/threonine-protein kinase